MSRSVRRFALPIVGALAAPGIGSALGSTLSRIALSSIGAGVGSATNTYTQTHNLGDALKSGALSGAGSYIGGNIGASVGGPTVATGLQSALGSDLGSAVGQIAGGNLALTPMNALLGASIGSNLASSLVPQKTGNVAGQGASTAFKAKRENEQDAPESFRAFGSLSPTQMSSQIATGGVYGGGASKQDSDYFLNLINRRLVTDQGQVDSDLSEINPIESSYLSQLGLGGYGGATDLLEAISRYRAA